MVLMMNILVMKRIEGCWSLLLREKGRKSSTEGQKRGRNSKRGIIKFRGFVIIKSPNLPKESKNSISFSFFKWIVVGMAWGGGRFGPPPPGWEMTLQMVILSPILNFCLKLWYLVYFFFSYLLFFFLNFIYIEFEY